MIARATLLAGLALGCAVPASTPEVPMSPMSPGFTGLAFDELPSPAGEQSLTPHLDIDRGGTLRLAWQERDGELTTLRFATYRGERWSSPTTIAEGDDWFVNWADFPSLVSGRDGLLIAHWLQRLGENTFAYGVRFSISSDDGVTWSAARWLHEDRSPVEHGFVSFAGTQAGFEAVWLDGRATLDGARGVEGDMHLMRRSIQANGSLGEELFLDRRVCSCCQTDAVWTERDGLFAAYRDRSPEEVRDIAIVLGSSGSTQDEPFFADGWEINGCPVNGPAVAAHGAGRAVAWFTGAGGGGGCVQVALAEDRTPPLFAAPIIVDDDLPEGRVDAAYLDNGTLIVTWMEHAEEGTEWRARTVARDGSLGESCTIAPISSERASGFLRMAAHGDRAFVAWTDLDDGSYVRVGRLRLRE